MATGNRTLKLSILADVDDLKKKLGDADKAVETNSSKIGEFKYGFARQKFSGGATTQSLWGGVEFGSNKFKQFPSYSGRQGRGSRGWFIYPTLRRIQPELINKWEAAYNRILDKWA